MQNDAERPDGQADLAEPPTRAEVQRERNRLAQVVAAQKQRAIDSGPAPDSTETERLIAEFRSRGGQVTTLPTGSAIPVDPTT